MRKVGQGGKKLFQSLMEDDSNQVLLEKAGNVWTLERVPSSHASLLPPTAQGLEGQGRLLSTPLLGPLEHAGKGAAAAWGKSFL